MSSKRTTFNPVWMNPILNPSFSAWLEPVAKSPYEATCKKCKIRFNLSNMGRQALVSHMEGSKHQKMMNAAVNLQLDMKTFIKKAQSTEASELSTEVAVARSDVGGSNINAEGCCPEAIRDENTLAAPSESISSVNTNISRSITKHFLPNEHIAKAEILWALKAVSSHYSFNSCSNLKDILCAMFPDSAIAKSISIGKTKTSYIVSYGLAPYFQEELLKNLRGCREFVICFDEALNRISQRGQMDIVVRYWEPTQNVVATRYLISSFLGHAAASDLLKNFTECLQSLSLSTSKLLQISMDGPNVNWKFVDDLKKTLYAHAEDRQLVELGSCGLHVVHGAFQSGHSAAGWKVNGILRAIYSLFKDSPARRADYIAVTGCQKFGKKFCQV